jgi:hypothetical protein
MSNMDMTKEGEVMKFSGVRYAVIDGPHSKAGHERIVVAYPTEQALRDLIAAPSILAFGFSSREEALADADGCRPTAATYQHVLQAVASRKTRKQQRFSWPQLLGDTGSDLRGLAKCLVHCFSEVVTSMSILLSRPAGHRSQMCRAEEIR